VWRVVVVALAVLWLGPGEAFAQADSSGPAVVPPPAAYVGGGTASGLEDLLRWRVDDLAGRTLWIHFESPPQERPAFWQQSEEALEEWNRVPGLPLRFRRTDHYREADIRFRWVRRFDESQAGTTEWQTDGEGWLSSATVTLAVEHVDGTLMSDEFVLLVALHELGHAIGLPHSEEPADVMHPGNRSRKPSDRDVRSAIQLYDLDAEASLTP
jgi:hypothetical protein